MTGAFHIGRSFTGHPLEDECPCHQAECGLVDIVDKDCTEHPIGAMKTLRQVHRAEDCPGHDRRA